MVKFFALILLLPTTVYGQVTLSEVLSNEPAGRVRLEWIELYNRSDVEADLSGFLLISSNDTTAFQQGSLVGAGEYVVIARQLTPEDGSDSFEGYWGDSSGIWGDSEIEDFAAYEGDFQLNNNSGDVTLADSAGTFLDQLFWNSASDDGRSVEKDDLSLDFTTWHDCYDPESSTPGRANSEIPSGGAGTFQADISPRVISLDRNGGSDQFTLSIDAGLWWMNLNLRYWPLYGMGQMTPVHS
jgi:hypothetical protein